MPICLSTGAYLPEVSGLTTVLAQMCDGLRQRGHEGVIVLTPRYEHAAADETGVNRLATIPDPAYPQARLSWPLAGAEPAA
jgi:hypothetical protein